MKTFQTASQKKEHSPSRSRTWQGQTAGLPRFLGGNREGDGLLVQRDGELPAVPRYQLPTPSLLQPPERRLPQLMPDLQLQLDDRTRQLALESLFFELNPDRLSSLIMGADLSPFNIQIPPPPRDVCAAPEPTPPSVRPGEEPAPPRTGTVGDVLRAATQSPLLYPGYCRLTNLAEDRVNQAWNSMTPWEAAGVITHLSVIALGGLAGAMANQDSRNFVLSQLNGTTLPIPAVDWLRVELYTGPDSIMFGTHVDVGALLQRYVPILGFGPGSPPAIGGPPAREPDLPGGVNRAESGEATAVDSGFPGRLSAAVAGGAPIPDAPRRRLQESLGEKLDHVRIHADHTADQLARDAAANAFTTGSHIFFRSGQYGPETGTGFHLLAHEATHVAQQQSGRARSSGSGVTVTTPDHPSEVEARATADRIASRGASVRQSNAISSAPASPGGLVQRDKSSGASGPTTGAVDVPGGESKTPSDQDKLAPGYQLLEDGRIQTPYGRTVSREQGVAESKVINSSGIYMAAYLARYNALRSFSMSQEDMDRLSADAGFTQQFQTGDIVLRLMDASDSAALANVTESNYSHSGIVQRKDGRLWVLDSYPGRKIGGNTVGEDSSQLIRFEDFFGDHGKEKIVNGLVLRVEGMTEEVRKRIDALITQYAAAPTTFDYDFRVDNGESVLYCSELVWRILKEAGARSLPPNEFARTKERAEGLVTVLEGLIAYQKSQGQDTTKAEENLKQLRTMLAKFADVTAEELYSPGSLERGPGFKTVSGFTREEGILGMFKVIVVSATVPADSWDTPDCYVVITGGGRSSVKDDTTTPSWNEELGSFRYDYLDRVSFTIWDEDLIFDDQLATVSGDLRPVRPAGQEFSLADGGSSLRVKVEAENPAEPQAPRDVQP